MDRRKDTMTTRNMSSVWRAAVLHAALPAALALLLFVGASFLVILPSFEEHLMDARRDLIREQVNSIWNLLEHYHTRVEAGELTLEEAQKRVIERIRSIRYGHDGKDYFWINDMQPTMIMHPYRPDLEGKDISDFADPQGKHLFMEFVETVRSEGAGYVDYQWQWKDDPTRIVPKVSYVRGFGPWSWIIGSGIYVNDVEEEIGVVSRGLAGILVLILLITAACITYLVWHAMNNEFERSRARQRQEKLLRALELKTMELESIVYVSSHDLRTPLVNIQGFSKELAAACKKLDELCDQLDIPHEQKQQILHAVRQDIPESLKFILASGDKMDTLLSGLLKLARMGRVELKIDTLDMNSILEDVVNSIRYQLHESGAEIIVEDDLPPCRADAAQINQVFTNLIDNAVKYRHHDRPPRIHVSGFHDDGISTYCIRDNGNGIAPEHQQQIFEVFHRLEPGGKVPGEGLGLTIVRRILDRLDGTIEVQSEPGNGATFFVTLPR